MTNVIWLHQCDQITPIWPNILTMSPLLLLYCLFVLPEINPYKATAASCHSSGGEITAAKTNFTPSAATK